MQTRLRMSPSVTPRTSPPLMVDAFGMNSFCVETPPRPPLPATRLYQNVNPHCTAAAVTGRNNTPPALPAKDTMLIRNSTQFSGMEHSQIKNKNFTKKGSSDSVSMNQLVELQHNKHDIEKAITMKKMQLTIKHQIEEHYKTLRSLDSMQQGGEAAELHELRANLLSMLASLEATQQMMASPSSPAAGAKSLFTPPPPLSSTTRHRHDATCFPNGKAAAAASRMVLLPLPDAADELTATGAAGGGHGSREKDMEANRRMLAACGWYHGPLSWQEADHLLQRTCLGTFLLRDSKSKDCDYALSVNHPEYGPTSIRINYSDGRFRLDSDKFVKMPGFHNIVDLVQFYYRSDKLGLSRHSKSDAPITLVKALYKDPPRLSHLARLAINSLAAKCGMSVADSAPVKLASRLDIPVKLASYLDSYRSVV